MKCFCFFLFFISIASYSQEVTDLKKIINLEKKGDSLIYDWSYEKNYQVRKQILNHFKNNKKDANYKKAKVRLIEAKAYQFNGKYNFDSAVYYSEKAIKKYNEFQLKDKLLKGKIYRALYHHTAYSGKWAAAMPIAKESLQSLLDTLPKNHDLIIDAQFDIGYINVELGNFSESLIYYENALKDRISLHGEIHHKVALSYMHLARNYRRVGMFKKELNALKKTAYIWENIKENRTSYEDKSYLYVCYNNLAKWFTEQGDLKKVESYLLKNEQLFKKYRNQNWVQEMFKGQTQLISWESLAKVKILQKDSLNALKYATKIINYIYKNPHVFKQTRSDVNKESFLVSALNLKAKLIEKKQPELAMQLYKKSIAIIEKKETSKSIKITSDRINLANLYSHQKEYGKAKNILNKGLKEAKNKKDFFDILKYYDRKGNIAFLENDTNLMTQFYEKAFAYIVKDTTQTIDLKNIKYQDCKQIGDNKYIDFVLNASLNFKNVYTKTKKTVYLKTAHNLIVLLTDFYADNFSSFRYNDKTHDYIQKINEQVLSTSLLLKDEMLLNTVLEKIAQNTSRFSWRKFLNVTTRKKINIPDTILVKENDLKKMLNFYKKSLYTTKNLSEAKQKIFKTKIFDLENELVLLDAFFENNYPVFYNQSQKQFSLQSIKNQLSNEQEIIKYIVTSKNIYAFSITKNKTKLVKIGAKDNVLNVLQPFINSLQNITDFNSNKASEVFKIVMPKVLNSTKKELVIIADDILQYLPFEILINAKNNYLITDYAISYASSLLLWNEQTSSDKNRRTAKIGVFAPSYKNNFSKLSGAKEEAIAINKLFNSDLYLDKNASKKLFLEKANQYSVLHLAMHSILNNENSEFSNLQFYGNSNEDKLFISEIYNLQLNADLVVLSACNTGVGQLEKGEGLVNCSRAFTYAGVPSTIISLWETPDKSTKEIMVSFYTNLKKGFSKSNALKNAKLNYLKNTEDAQLKHPYYWAGFVLYGNDATIQLDGDTNYLKWIGITIIIAIMVFFFIKKRRKSI